jgi:hypothetical protein
MGLSDFAAGFSGADQPLRANVDRSAGSARLSQMGDFPPVCCRTFNASKLTLLSLGSQFRANPGRI